MGFDMRDLTGGLTLDLTTDELIDRSVADSRVPLSQVKQHPSGACFPDPGAVVEPKAEGWEGRLDVGAPEMMADLQRLAQEGLPRGPRDAEFPLRLICRRHRHVFNTSGNVPAANKGRAYNPCYLHPEDLAAHGVAPGEIAELRSAHGAIPVIVEADPGLRRGLVSMMFGYGGPPARDGDVMTLGSSVNRLTSSDELFDRYTGQPRMSNVPVALARRELASV